MATGPKVNMPKPSKKTKAIKAQTKEPSISFQLERIICCLEKQLSGQVFPDFNSKKELENKED